MQLGQERRCPQRLLAFDDIFRVIVKAFIDSQVAQLQPGTVREPSETTQVGRRGQRDRLSYIS